MNRSRSFFPILSALLALFFAAAAVHAQAVPPPVEPSHDVTLQVIIGTNDGAGQPLPAELSSISRSLKSNFSFTNYRVAETFLGRIGNRGDLEYKSIFSLTDQKADTEPQTFFEWSLRGLRNVKDVNDKTVLQAETLRFGGRVPIKVSMDASGKLAPMINYEAIGLNLQRLTFPVGTPTLVGSITMTKSLGTMFLVITVRSAS
jgi:hypothetical protein